MNPDNGAPALTDNWFLRHKRKWHIWRNVPSSGIQVPSHQINVVWWQKKKGKFHWGGGFFCCCKDKCQNSNRKCQGICLNPGFENHQADQSLILENLWWWWWWWQNSVWGNHPAFHLHVTVQRQWHNKQHPQQPLPLGRSSGERQIRRCWLYTEVSDCSLMPNLWLFGSMNSSPSRKKGSCVTVTTREKSRWRSEKTRPWRSADVTGSSLTKVHWRPLPFWCWYCIVGPETR